MPGGLSPATPRPAAPAGGSREREARIGPLWAAHGPVVVGKATAQPVGAVDAAHRWRVAASPPLP